MVCTSGRGRAGTLVLGVCAAVTAVAAGEGRTGPAVAYHADFEKGAGREWSARKTEVTPKGDRRFLGRFGADQVALTLTDLPRHECLRVSFDLFVIHSWDGDDAKFGPDAWWLEARNGPELLCHLFASESGRQTFPDPLPGPRHPPRTGASEKSTLGYTWPSGGVADAVYRIRCVFSHADAKVTLVFAALASQGLSDESWGLDNVKVEAFRRPPAPDAKRLAALWAQLGDKDPAKACAAIEPLVLAGDAAVAALPAKFRAPRLDVEIKRLLAELDVDDWRRRNSATAALEAKGPAIAPLLRHALKDPASLEVRTRLELILRSFAKAARAPAQGAEYPRALRVLALGRTARALRALEDLAAVARDRAVQERAATEAALIANEKLRAFAGAARSRAQGGDLRAAAESLKRAAPFAPAGETAVRKLLDDLLASLGAGRGGPDAALWDQLGKALAARRAQAAAGLAKARSAGRAPQPKPKPAKVPPRPRIQILTEPIIIDHD